mmetsp:Transcript_64759/g.118256  ORF Transcript_64759/g.118256 Transcript_64759/m.118256 type:complete len:217 (+) Transcript_64759:215-865(+)
MEVCLCCRKRLLTPCLIPRRLTISPKKLLCRGLLTPCFTPRRLTITRKKLLRPCCSRGLLTLCLILRRITITPKKLITTQGMGRIPPKLITKQGTATARIPIVLIIIIITRSSSPGTKLRKKLLMACFHLQVSRWDLRLSWPVLHPGCHSSSFPIREHMVAHHWLSSLFMRLSLNGKKVQMRRCFQGKARLYWLYLRASSCLLALEWIAVTWGSLS